MAHEHHSAGSRLNQPSTIVYFSDGNAALRFDGSSSDEISFPRSSEGVSDEGQNGLYIIATSSGNEYVVSPDGGLAIDAREGKVFRMLGGHALPSVVFGEPWAAPGGRVTTPVVGVLGEVNSLGHSRLPERRIDERSPLPVAQEWLVRAELALAKASADRARGRAVLESANPMSQRERLGLPSGFKTELGSTYIYTPEGHSERWKFDGTHHDPMGIAVFVQPTPANRDMISREGTEKSHLPPERRAHSYIVEKDESGGFRIVRDVCDVGDPSRLYYARINGKDQIVQHVSVSLHPKVGYYVFEFGSTEDGQTIRHPGHKVSEITT